MSIWKLLEVRGEMRKDYRKGIIAKRIYNLLWTIWPLLQLLE